VVEADPGQSLTALIIVTSALSVFGQYIDTVHRQEMADMRNDLESLGLKNIKGDVPNHFSDVKKRWDHTLSAMEECKRAIGPVICLFTLLIIAVVLEMFFILSRPGWWNIAYCIYGSGLLLAAGWLGVRALQMGSQRKNTRSSSKEIKTIYTGIEKAIELISK